MKKRLLILSSLFGMITGTAAFAVPAAPGALMNTPAPLVQEIQHRQVTPRRAKPRPPAARPRMAPRRYAPGTRLRAAPSGYRRYAQRPSYWRARNCVVVANMWFCP